MTDKLQLMFARSLERPGPYRVAFLAILVLAPPLVAYTSTPYGPELYPIYLIAPILLGIGFRDAGPTFFVVASLLLVFFRYILTPYDNPHPVTLALLFCIYLLLAIMSVGLTKNYLQTKHKTLELIAALAKSLDSRDANTASHSENAARYALMIAEEMKLSPKMCESIYIGGLLHDIGKIGVPEHILLNPKKLSNDDFAHIKEHPSLGFHTLQHIDEFEKNGVLDIVLYHHERYDGKGYPNGLKGEDIPLPARIMAIADTFDAMTSNRVYRDALGLDLVVDEIRKQKGSQFDPDIADVFLTILSRQGGHIFEYLKTYKTPF